MYCLDYLQADIRNVDDILTKDHGDCLKQRGRGNMPYPQDYMLKLYITNELDGDEIIR